MKRPGPKTPAPGSLGADDTLLDHCYRSARAWDMRTSRFFGTWGDRDFFSLLSMPGTERTALTHAVRDCQLVAAPLTGMLDQGPNPFRTPPRSFTAELRRIGCTDLDDVSAVTGGEERLEQAARQAACAAGCSGVRVHFGCDYHVIGDDVPGICRRLEQEGLPVELLNPPLPRFTDSSSSNWWRSVLAPACAPQAAREPLSVNLAGFAWPQTRALGELCGLLETLGVRVLGRFLPGRAGMERHAHAALSVLSPWQPVLDVLAPILAERGFATIKPAAPYGVRGTQAWLASVLAALGQPAPDPRHCEDRLLKTSADWPSLRQAAGEITVGLVADFGSALELCEPAFFFGLEPVPLLLDLGFRVKLIGARAAEALQSLTALPPQWRTRASALEWDPRAGTLDAVRGQGLSLIYCDALFSRPLKALGLTPWSIADLEPGLAGAERSLRRLLCRARLRLYAEHGGFLGG